ncbi:hypothetical protein ACFYP0_19565 [Micromonospora arida]|uniref:hypothetical protein n=1 Tax=Micromonospora arida TaxID=2203715 RepID=UPI0033AD07D9
MNATNGNGSLPALAAAGAPNLAGKVLLDSVFVSGDDAEAKRIVSGLLVSFGHTDVIDLGDLSTARGTEMLLPLWLRLYGRLDTVNFNIKVVR